MIVERRRAMPSLRRACGRSRQLLLHFSPRQYGEASNGAIGFYNPSVSCDRRFFGLAPVCLYHLALMNAHLASIFTE
jgi:hypothetical protein